jgi:hypothetical protein
MVFWFYGLVGSPGALLSPGVLVGRVLDFERCRSVWRYFLGNVKG